jgi:hypothetical protein
MLYNSSIRVSQDTSCSVAVFDREKQGSGKDIKSREYVNHRRDIVIEDDPGRQTTPCSSQEQHWNFSKYDIAT